MAVRVLKEYMDEELKEIAEHKWYLSEHAGKDVGDVAAIKSWAEKGFLKKFHDKFFLTHHITSLDSEVKKSLEGDCCLILEARVVTRNYDNSKEAVLDEELISYCVSNKESCCYRQVDASGNRLCVREKARISAENLV